jgi:hypothetical protein
MARGAAVSVVAVDVAVCAIAMAGISKNAVKTIVFNVFLIIVSFLI